MGSVWAMVSTASSTDRPSCSMVMMILEVSDARMLALTPLPRPSERTRMSESCAWTISTLSPQSSSPYLLRDFHAMSMCIIIRVHLHC